ncbi:MAG: hypothetical protein RBR02_06405 [Desulfuromonadaceae bacterium]|nr:hypothetical protein [Desulfuromonadaceae bacterium]
MANYYNNVERLVTDSDYTESLLNVEESKYAQSAWQQFLKGTTEQFQSESEALEQQSQINLSQAYANYARGQMAIKSAEELGTGFREQLTETATQSLAQEQQAITQSMTKDYSKLLSEYTGTIMGEAEKVETSLKKLDELALRYGEEELELDTRDVIRSIEDETESERGQLFYDRVFNTIRTTEELDKGGEDFADFLLREGGEELYNFYYQNQDLARGLIGGLETSEFNVERESRVETLNKIETLKETRNVVDTVSIPRKGEIPDRMVSSVTGKVYIKDKYIFEKYQRNVALNLANTLSEMAPNAIKNDIIEYNGTPYLYLGKKVFIELKEK